MVVQVTVLVNVCQVTMVYTYGNVLELKVGRRRQREMRMRERRKDLKVHKLIKVQQATKV